MVRKCTLKSLPRSPKQRITSKISRADADMREGELRPDPVIGIVPRTDLGADIHDCFSARRATGATRPTADCVFSGLGGKLDEDACRGIGTTEEIVAGYRFNRSRRLFPTPAADADWGRAPADAVID